MKLLLDTHIWIWAVNVPQKLSRSVQRQIARTSNELYLSPISIWEAHLLVQRKHLRLRLGFAEWLVEVSRKTPLREAPLNFAVAEQAVGLRLPQSDPGDLFLAATAMAFDLTLVTTDQQFLHYPGLKTLSND